MNILNFTLHNFTLRKANATATVKNKLFCVLFGTYKPEHAILTSSPPGLETMLDAFPLFQELITALSNNAKAAVAVSTMIHDIEGVHKDLWKILGDVVNSMDPVKVQLWEDMRKIRTPDTGLMGYLSYHYVLVRVLQVGWKVEYMLLNFDSILTAEDKIMMGGLQATVSKMRKDLSLIYGHRLQLPNTFSQMNQSDLMQEVYSLLEKNPFNK